MVKKTTAMFQMNHTLANDEFKKFKNELNSVSLIPPVNDAKIEAAYDKCQSLLETLYTMQVHPFRSQLVRLRGQNILDAKPYQKMDRLILLVDNILDDIRIRIEKDKSSSKNDILNQPIEKMLKLQPIPQEVINKNLIKDLHKHNSDLQKAFDTSKEQFDELYEIHKTLSEDFDKETTYNSNLTTSNNRYRISLILISFGFYSYIAFTLFPLLEIPFNVKWFSLAEAVFIVPFLTYYFKRIPKWIKIASGAVVIGGVVMFLIKQPGWEKEFNTALWGILGGLVSVFIGSIFKLK